MELPYVCPLCDAISGEGKLLISNTIIKSYKNFSLLPVLDPLIAGHAMLVSKQHFSNLATMPASCIKEVVDIFNELAESYDFFEDVLVIEQGAYDDQNAGGCIVHTHLHIIPSFGNYYNVLDNYLPALNFGTIGMLHLVKDPYIMTMNMSYGFRLYKAYNVHSQAIRNALRLKLGFKAVGTQGKDKGSKILSDTLALWAKNNK